MRTDIRLIAFLAAWFSGAPGAGLPQMPPARDLEALPFAPKQYVCYRAPSPPAFDGRLDEAAWQGAPWTDHFVNIEGGSRPAPRFFTRAKMLWDDTYLYLAFDLEEPEIWGTLTERDALIYYDNKCASSACALPPGCFAPRNSMPQDKARHRMVILPELLRASIKLPPPLTLPRSWCLL